MVNTQSIQYIQTDRPTHTIVCWPISNMYSNNKNQNNETTTNKKSTKLSKTKDNTYRLLHIHIIRQEYTHDTRTTWKHTKCEREKKKKNEKQKRKEINNEPC